MTITWNITKKCFYNCDICATHDTSRRELTLAEKAIALDSLLTLGSSIDNIDFSGGDPLYDDNSKKIIANAIERVGRDRICVTTTGKSLEALETDEKALFLNFCELTLETGNLCTSARQRNEKHYNSNNYNAIMNNFEYIKKLIINIPVFDTTQDIQINQLISLVNKIPIADKTVSLLRMMPVGKASIKHYPNNYDISYIIRLFSQGLDKNIGLHIHCALRGAYGDSGHNRCNMLYEKIGIDCAGNVFVCPWGGYIGAGIYNNPFYLGNLLKDDAFIIINNEYSQHLKNVLTDTPCCRIFSYCCSNGDMLSNSDPLHTNIAR